MLANKPTTKEEFLKLTYRELKQRTGVDIKNWSEWLNSKSAPVLDTLERVAVDLGMSLPELVEAFVERRSQTMQRSEKKAS